MTIERWDTKEIIFEMECESWSDLIKGATKAKVSFYKAHLRYADLRYADLRYADLRYANLKDADLRYANLRDADLRYADLQDADLQNADLQNADLRNVIGNKIEVKSMQLNTYSISFDKYKLNIGCESHTFKEWEDFSNEEIDRMDKGSLIWWKKWKDFIFEAIELSDINKELK